MTSRARPRRRLPPPAVMALSAPEAGDTTATPWDLGARPLPAVRAFRDGPQACRQPGKRSSPDSGDSPREDNAGRDGIAPARAARLPRGPEETHLVFPAA